MGVDGEDACKYITKANGEKTSCDLKAGEEYVYKNKIEVLKIYPKVRMTLIYQYGYNCVGSFTVYVQHGVHIKVVETLIHVSINNLVINFILCIN